METITERGDNILPHLRFTPIGANQASLAPSTPKNNQIESLYSISPIHSKESQPISPPKTIESGAFFRYT